MEGYNKYRKFFNKAILSGLIISISAYLYSAMNGSIIGALLFSFGLITIVHYKWFIFTGSAGFIEEENEVNTLASILLGNVIGCIIGAFILYACQGSETQNAFIENAIKVRSINYGIDSLMRLVCRGMMCGLIMTIAVKFARKGLDEGVAYFLPLLLGVPLFLISGFYHSIVDAFYFSYGIISKFTMCKDFNGIMEIICSWLLIVIGNFIGCNIPRLIMFELKS